MHEEMEMGVNLREFGALLIKRIWVVALCIILMGTATLIYTKTAVTPMYEAGFYAYVNNKSYKDTDAVSSQDLAVAIRLSESYAHMIVTDLVLERVKEELDIDASTAQLRKLIKAEAVEESEMFTVTVTTSNPQLSVDVANAIAKVAPEEIPTIVEGSSAKIIEYPKMPTKPSSPNVTQNTIIGLLLGAVIGLGIVFLEMILDTRIKSEDDLVRISKMPVLGVIPDMTVDRKKKRFKFNFAQLFNIQRKR